MLQILGIDEIGCYVNDFVFSGVDGELGAGAEEEMASAAALHSESGLSSGK